MQLKHALAKIPRLVGPLKKTVLLLTDEDEWLHQELEENAELIKGWNIRTFPRTANNSFVGNVRGSSGRDGTYNGVRFFATMKLVQQCEAYVGHFGSAMAHTIFSSMCIQSNGTMGVCPPAYDFRLLRKEYNLPT